MKVTNALGQKPRLVKKSTKKRKCPICSGPYRPKRKGQKTCSATCGKKLEGITKRKYWPACKNCGKDFIPKKSAYRTYCSRECAFRHKSMLSEIKHRPRTKVYFKNCPICEKSFVTPTRERRYCSRGCRLEAGRRRAREQSVSVRETNPYVKKECEYCRRKFKTNYMVSRRKYCSVRCSDKASMERHLVRKKEQQKLRMAESKGATGAAQLILAGQRSVNSCMQGA